MTIECDCGNRLELPEDFFEGGAGRFFHKHGHFPALIRLRCQCSASIESGPAVGSPQECNQRDFEWANNHRQHGVS